MMRSRLIVALCCLSIPAVVFADVPAVYPAPHPGDPPEAPYRLAASGLFFAVAVVASGFIILRKRNTTNVTKLTIGLGVAIGALLIIGYTATPSPEYHQWKQDYDAWKRGDVIEVYNGPVRRYEEDWRLELEQVEPR